MSFNMSSRKDNDNAIAVEAIELSKCYRIYSHPRDRLLQAIWGRDRRCQPKRYYREFWALQQVSFQLGLGQTLGVIGRNGSGKSTLLQILCGTLSPTAGNVYLRGRVGALLELGSGFNPEFSGIENVFLNASLLGLSQIETEQRLDQILSFADIGEFINQPVKTYSSGMAVRLAFAVQAHVDPDILVVDEALAVGDELFQKKCYSHLERLKERGTAVILVTHSCPQIIQHCDQALLLHKGKARMLGEPARVTVTYQRLINASDAEWEEAFHQQPANDQPQTSVSNDTDGKLQETDIQIDQEQHSWLDPCLIPQSTEIYPNHGAEIIDAWFESTNGEQINVLPYGEDFTLCMSYQADDSLLDRIENVCLTCHIASHTGQRVTGQTIPATNARQGGPNLITINPAEKWTARFSFKGGLWPGVYFIGGGIISFNGQGRTFVHRVVDFRALRILEREPVSVIGSCSLQAAPPMLNMSR